MSGGIIHLEPVTTFRHESFDPESIKPTSRLMIYFEITISYFMMSPKVCTDVLTLRLL